MDIIGNMWKNSSHILPIYCIECNITKGEIKMMEYDYIEEFDEELEELIRERVYEEFERFIEQLVEY